MILRLMIGAVSAAALTLPAAAFAREDQFGTAQEARAMLDKVVAALKADKTKALDMFNKGEGGFLDRDLYPFCFNISDAKIVAVGNPNASQYLGGSVAFNPILGEDGKTLRDAEGKKYGLEMYTAAQKPEGEITEVSYLFPRPGTDATPVGTVSFVTKVGDLGCGVGYYK